MSEKETDKLIKIHEEGRRLGYKEGFKAGRQAEREHVKKLLWDIIGIKKKNGSYEFILIDEQMACFLQDYGIKKEAGKA